MTDAPHPSHASNPEPAEDRVLELVAECLERIDALPAGDDEATNLERIRAETDSVCARHPDLADAVRARMGLLLRTGLAGETHGERRPQLRTLGRYRLIGELGRGGMGVVYLALDPKLGRLVALKALATRLVASERARARFDREIKAIAGLKHPRIVPIYEVGEAAGVPYFTMEFVEGKTLAQVVSALRDLDVPTDELNTTHLGAATFLELSHTPSGDDSSSPEEAPAGPRRPPTRGEGFLPNRWGKTYVETVCRFVLDVAEALQCAHEHGVVHRDVKPSNVLVAADGRALLFDFGLARVDTEDTMTLTGDFAGTPYYVAPEQISAKGKGVDGRSDVYALGVTLYELLTLRRPFEGRNAQAIFRQVLSKDPPLLRKHNRLVPRDLETICLAALEKDPARRYQSGAELAADLRRFLEFRPVHARPVGVVTRTTRLVRRHPGAATAVALAGLILVGLPVGLGITTALVAAERNEAEVARREAEGAAERARAVNAFLGEMLAAADPNVSGASGVTVREMLDVAAARVGGQFVGQPAVEAELRRTIGTTYLALGHQQDARMHLERALELRTSLADPDPRDVAVSRFDLGWCLGKLGELDRALELMRGATAELRALGEDDMDVARALQGIAATLGDLDRLDEARALLLEAQDILEDLHGTQHKAIVQNQINLGKVALWSDDTGEAERYYRSALDTSRELFGDDDLMTARVKVHLGSLMRTIENHARAAELWEEALATRRKILGDDHPETGQLMVNLSRVERILGRFERAEELAREGLAIQARLLGPDHVQLADGLQNRAMALERLGRPEEGIADLERALDILVDARGEDSSSAAMARFELGRFLATQDRYGEAIAHYRAALAVLEETHGPDARLTANTAYLLGGLLHEVGELEEAEVHLREALRVHRAMLAPTSITLLLNENELGLLLEARGEHGEAVPLLEESFRRFQASAGHVEPAQVLTTGLALGLAYAGDGRTQEALEHYAGALAWSDRYAPGGVVQTVNVLVAYAELMLSLERPGDALPLLERALEMGQRLAPESELAHLETRATIGHCLARLGRFEEAEPLLLESYASMVELVGLDARVLRTTIADLIALYGDWGKPDQVALWRARGRAAGG